MQKLNYDAAVVKRVLDMAKIRNAANTQYLHSHESIAKTLKIPEGHVGAICRAHGAIRTHRVPRTQSLSSIEAQIKELEAKAEIARRQVTVVDSRDPGYTFSVGNTYQKTDREILAAVAAYLREATR